MKLIQTFKVIVLFVTGFMFFNIFVMSDSGWVDQNNIIFSHVNGNIGIGRNAPVHLLHLQKPCFKRRKRRHWHSQSR